MNCDAVRYAKKIENFMLLCRLFRIRAFVQCCRSCHMFTVCLLCFRLSFLDHGLQTTVFERLPEAFVVGIEEGSTVVGFSIAA